MACLRSLKRFCSRTAFNYSFWSKDAAKAMQLSSIIHLEKSSFSTTAADFQRRIPGNRHNSTSVVNSLSLEESSSHVVTPSTHGVADRINEQISQNSHGRLFAVIYIGGHQFKVTTEDLLLIRTNRRFPDVGDRICIDKVLLVGGKDFTMVGRPLLNNVRVEATVVEKTLSHRKIWFYFIRRKGVKKLKLIQDFLTVIRINSIEVSEVEDDVD